MKSRYSLMKDSIVTNNLGQNYPDICTYPIKKFVYTFEPQKYILTQADIDRFDILIYAYYSTSDYTDLIIELNNYGSTLDMNAGETILLPIIDDINTFFQTFS